MRGKDWCVGLEALAAFFINCYATIEGWGCQTNHSIFLYASDKMGVGF